MKKFALLAFASVMLFGCMDMSEREEQIVAEASQIIAIGTFVVEKRVYGPDEDGKPSCALILIRPYWDSSDRFTARFYGEGIQECGDAPLGGKVEITWSTLPDNIFRVHKL